MRAKIGNNVLNLKKKWDKGMLIGNSHSLVTRKQKKVFEWNESNMKLQFIGCNSSSIFFN